MSDIDGQLRVHTPIKQAFSSSGNSSVAKQAICGLTAQKS
jgi:hypothetical protein